MKREIKFRGKHSGDGEWVYGDLVRDFCFDPDGVHDYKCAIVSNNDYCEVIQETVGQYTGLKDKNGVEIYENCLINNKYKVKYIAPCYILTDILSNDIISIQEVINNENGIEITKEYSEV